MNAEKPAWVNSISLGNILTMLAMAAGGAAVWVRIAVSDGEQGQKIVDHDRRITALEYDRNIATRELAAQLQSINNRLSTIEGYLRGRPASPP